MCRSKARTAGNLYKLPPGPSCLIHCLHSLQLKGENRGKKSIRTRSTHTRVGVLTTRRLLSPHDDDNWNIMMVDDDDDEGDYGIDDDCEDDADCKNTWKGPEGITV